MADERPAVLSRLTSGGFTMVEQMLSVDDAGRTVSVPKDAEVVLDLPENPTTGFRWHVDISDGLELMSDAYTPMPGGGAGIGGMHEFRLRPARIGLVHVVGRLRRTWEPDSRQVYEFFLDVQ